jgi:hypothetical protein
MKKTILQITALVAFVLFGTIANAQSPTSTLNAGNYQNRILYNDTVYFISGQVNIDSGYALTIQPGTIIKGIKNNSNKAVLIVKRGAQIIANASPSQPIVFTSDQASGARAPGDWGGVIICGRAPVNFPIGFGQVEGGLFGTAGLFGGNVPTDNSGILRYVRIEFSGIAFAPNNETNGLTLAGVGNGTTVEYVQTSYSGDDGIEWFGGTVNCRNLIVYRTLDDDFDTDNGYSGTVQFALSMRDPSMADNPSISTSEGFESDNNDNTANGVFPTYYTSPRTKAIFSNVTSIGPRANYTGTLATGYNGLTNGDGGKGVRIRRGSQLSLFNSVFAGWGVGLLINDLSTSVGQNSDSSEFRNNTFAHMTASNATNAPFRVDGAATPLNTISALRAWYSARSNDTATLAQVGLTGFSLSNPMASVIPATGSVQLSGANFTSSSKLTSNSFLTPVSYRGAFGSTDWTAGWASFNPINADYNTSIKPTTQTVSGNISSNTTWTNDKIWKISGQVNVDSGYTLTIQPGTVIQGIKNNSNKAVLIVKRGAKIIADGSAVQPIVFTSDQASGARAAGDWGGVIVCGRAPVNFPVGFGQVEGGLFGTAGLFGGNVPTDNSGILRYVRIEFSGIAFAPNNETNGLTLAGVGNGTAVEYVQTSYSGDDGIEWFGGTVNCRNLIVYRTLDDDFDTDNGYSGTVQFGVSMRDPSVADNPSISTSESFESDNNDNTASGVFPTYYTTPRTKAIFTNITSVGPRTNYTGTLASGYNGLVNGDGGKGVRIRRGSQLSLFNSVFSGWGVGLLINDLSTAVGQNSDSSEFRNNTFAHMTSSNATNAPFRLDGAATPLNTISALRSWFAARNNDTTTLAQVGLTGFSLSNPMATLIPASGSAQLSGASFTSSTKLTTNTYITPVTYRGAFGASDWTSGWANFDPINSSYSNANFTSAANANLTIKAFFEGSYDAATGTHISDTVTVKLYKSTAPYEFVQSFKTTINSNGVASVKLPVSELGKTYFVALANRNSIETWSANPVTIKNIVSAPAADVCFSCASANTYGENVKSASGAFLIYSGDINQDGLCDASDLANCSNNQNQFGYLGADVNNDTVVDNIDLNIVDNNVANIIQIIRPF